MIDTLTLEIEVSDKLCVIGPAPSAKLFVFDLLLRRLFSDWEKVYRHDTVEMVRYKLPRFQQIADLLPRLDIDGFGFDVGKVSITQIQEIFFYQLDKDNKPCPSKLVDLHNIDIDPDPDDDEVVTEPEPGKDISDWNPPLKSSGSGEIDLMAGLCVAFTAEGALALSNKFDRCRLQLLLRQHNRHHEDPDKRRDKYLKKYYERFKSENKAVVENALGLDFDPTTLMQTQAKKNSKS